jgi:hypothetical protein
VAVVSDAELHIHTELADRSIIGMDTFIATMPEAFYVDVAGSRSLKIQQFGRWLRALSEQQARNVGEQLHHADYVITTSPSTVEARGSMHDCESCRAGVRSALRKLIENPTGELIVGSLYWAGPAERTQHV